MLGGPCFGYMKPTMARKTAEVTDLPRSRHPVLADIGDDQVRAAGDGVLGAIGDTPLVRLRRCSPRPDLVVWAKLERANPGGGAKARPAAAMLTAALEQGQLAPNGTVVESSSGNMGVGLAQACASLGRRLVCVTDSRANERERLILRLRFGCSLSQQQVGERLGIS